jgi:hypothetical protein
MTLEQSIELALERRDYLIDAIRTMNNALDNGLIGDVLLELRRSLATIEGWRDGTVLPD